MTTAARQLPRLTHSLVFWGAVPIMFANAAAPLVGLVDTFLAARFAGTLALAGIGLGAAVYGIFYWGFGFLRMSTAGLAAQSDGADDQRAVQAHLLRAVPLGLLIGTLILAAGPLIIAAALQIFPAESAVAREAAAYLTARLWGLPATLGSIALMGWFIGLARPRLALYMQIVLNGLNAPLSYLFVAELGFGLPGIGYASAIAEWGGFFAGSVFALAEIKRRGGFSRGLFSRTILLDTEALKKLGVANGNIFIRTLALNFGFLFFARAATEQGTIFLAGFHVLLQFITLIALVLDSFAHVAEAHAGAAFGKKDLVRFDRAVKLTSIMSAGFACALSVAVFVCGPFAINLISADPAVQASARTYLPYCALAPVLGFAAWQLDGIFIGITRTAAMRNAGVAALLIYLALHSSLTPSLAGHGVWLAFLGYYVARALTMLPAWPGIKRDLSGE